MAVTVNDTGEIIKQTQGSAQFFREDLSLGISLEMIFIPGGTFTMGAATTEVGSSENERPQHQVKVPPFYMGKFQVTQAQWRQVASWSKVKSDLDNDPSRFKSNTWGLSKGNNLPVENISWQSASEFCQRLSQKTGKTYRLPSEAEWEYAARAGTTTPFHFGENITTDLANYDGKNLSYKNGTKGKYRKKTTPVGFFQVANAFGLYDMHGNVWEWCQDDWHLNYENAPDNGTAWLSENDNTKVLRGGSWDVPAHDCRSACRINSDSSSSFHNIGFRVVCVGTRST